MSAMDEMLSNMTVSSSGTVNTPIFTITMVIFLILLLAGIIYVVFKMYEAKKPPVESIVLIAVLTAIATVGRIILMSIPAVNLASFIIIMVGVVFGKEEGFLVGALTAFVSGLFMVSLWEWDTGSCSRCLLGDLWEPVQDSSLPDLIV